MAATAAAALLFGGLAESGTSSGTVPGTGHFGTARRRVRGRRHPGARRCSSRPACAPGPTNVRGLDLLGLAYQQRARETGDPSYYVKSAGVLRRALRLAPHDLDATGGLASLALSRHRFGARARSSAGERREDLADDRAQLRRRRRRARRARPLPPGVPGLRHDGAPPAGHLVVRARRLRARAPRQRRRRPRRSPARSRRGSRREGAARLDRMAARQARARPRAARLGGRLPSRSRSARSPATSTRSMRWRRSSSPRAARCIATELERRAVDTIPLPQFVGLYADLLNATGHPRAAAVQYATEDGIRRLFAANGVRTDLETALFDVDHGIRSHASLALAGKAQRERPSIDGDDVLAWALARNGRCGEALHYSQLRAPARHERQRQALPPRPRSSAASAATRVRGRDARCAQPPLLRALDFDPEEARVVKRLLLIVARCYLLVPVAGASAHPLGNFTINRFARVEVAGNRLYVRYVVDMAEIPTLQQRADPDRSLVDHRRRPACAAAGTSHRARASTRCGAACARRVSRRSYAGRPSRAARASKSTTATTPTGSGGRRSSSARPRVRPRASFARTRRTCFRARSTCSHAQPRRSRRLTMRRRCCSRARRFRRLTGSPTPASPRLSSSRHLSALVVLVSLAACDLLGRGARALSRSRQDDRVRLPASARAVRPGTRRCSG